MHRGQFHTAGSTPPSSHSLNHYSSHEADDNHPKIQANQRESIQLITGLLFFLLLLIDFRIINSRHDSIDLSCERLYNSRAMSGDPLTLKPKPEFLAVLHTLYLVVRAIGSFEHEELSSTRVRAFGVVACVVGLRGWTESSQDSSIIQIKMEKHQKNEKGRSRQRALSIENGA